MQINNLTQSDVKDFSSLANELKKSNPDLDYRIFNQDSVVNAAEYKTLRKQVDELAGIICGIEQHIKNIFGNHILIKGQFVDLKNL